MLPLPLREGFIRLDFPPIRLVRTSGNLDLPDTGDAHFDDVILVLVEGGPDSEKVVGQNAGQSLRLVGVILDFVDPGDRR